MTDEHHDEMPAANAHSDAADAHAGSGHGEHGHEESTLGPIDWGKWALAIAGGLGGLIVVVFFAFALGGIP